MVLHSSGAISMNQIHIEAGGAPETRCSLNDSDFTALAAVYTSYNSMRDFYGKSSYTPPVPVTNNHAKLLAGTPLVFHNPQTEYNNVYITGHISIDYNSWLTITVTYVDGRTRNLGYYWGIAYIQWMGVGGGYGGAAWTQADEYPRGGTRWRYRHSDGYRQFTSILRQLTWTQADETGSRPILEDEWKIEKLAGANGTNIWKWSSIGGNIAKIEISTSQYDVYNNRGLYGFKDIEVLWDF